MPHVTIGKIEPANFCIPLMLNLFLYMKIMDVLVKMFDTARALKPYFRDHLEIKIEKKTFYNDVRNEI